MKFNCTTHRLIKSVCLHSLPHRHCKITALLAANQLQFLFILFMKENHSFIKKLAKNGLHVVLKQDFEISINYLKGKVKKLFSANTPVSRKNSYNGMYRPDDFCS